MDLGWVRPSPRPGGLTFTPARSFSGGQGRGAPVSAQPLRSINPDPCQFPS
jgi:hypothetical protein